MANDSPQEPYKRSAEQARRDGAACLAAALDYLRRGWCPLALCPLDHKGMSEKHLEECQSPGKVPFHKWKALQTSFPTEDEVRGWWRNHPTANVGVAAGGPGRLISLDLDGPTAWEELNVLAGGELTATLQFTTGKGDRLLFLAPEGVELRTTAKPLIVGELRFQYTGGQTVMPPSRHYTGREYGWLDGHRPGEIELAPAPLWLVEQLRPAVKAERAPRERTSKERTVTSPPAPGEPITKDHRNNELTRLAGMMRRQGFSYEAIRVALLTVNRERCRPVLEEVEVEGIARSIAKYPPAPRTETGQLGGTASDKKQEQGEPWRLSTRALSDYRPRPVRYVATGYLPRGKEVVVAGPGGIRKTAVAISLAASVTTGKQPLGLPGAAELPASDVLIYAREDDPEDTLSPRLRAAGADLSRVHNIVGIEPVKSTTPGERKLKPFTLRDVDALRRTLEDSGEVRLIIIDPIAGAVASAGADTHKDGEVRSVLEPLAELAAEFDVLVLCIAHTGKAGDRKAADKVLGSVAFVNLARLAFVVGRDDDDTGYLCPIKCNLGKWPASLKFKTRGLTELEQATALAGYADHLDPASRQELAGQLFHLDWLGPCDMTADEVTSYRKPTTATVQDAEKAAIWMRARLAAGGEDSDTVVRDGNSQLNMNHRLRWWRDTVLKGQLRGSPTRVLKPDGTVEKWLWSLPVK